MRAKEIVRQLKAQSNPANTIGVARFGFNCCGEQIWKN